MESASEDVIVCANQIKPIPMEEDKVETPTHKLKPWSRTTSQKDNFIDCFSRLWIGSDPLVCQERRKGQKTCKVRQAFGHTSGSKLCPPRDTPSEDLAFANLLI